MDESSVYWSERQAALYPGICMKVICIQVRERVDRACNEILFLYNFSRGSGVMQTGMFVESSEWSYQHSCHYPTESVEEKIGHNRKSYNKGKCYW